MGWAMTATELPELDVDKAIAEHIRDERPDLTALVVRIGVGASPLDRAVSTSCL